MSVFNDMMDLLKLHLTLKWRLFMLIYEFMFSFMSAFNLSLGSYFLLFFFSFFSLVIQPQCLLLLSRLWTESCLENKSKVFLNQISINRQWFDFKFKIQHDHRKTFYDIFEASRICDIFQFTQLHGEKVSYRHDDDHHMPRGRKCV